MSSHLSRRHFIGAGAASLASALVFGGCGEDGASPAQGTGSASAGASAGNQETTKVRVGNLVGACMSPLFLAHGMGLFAEEGLKVELTFFGNAGDNLSSLVTGATQVIHNPFSNTFVARDVGEDLVIIAGSGKFGLEVVARGGSGITSLADLVARRGTGVRVGTARVNTQELTLFHLLKKNGLSYSDVEMVFFTDNLALGESLINGDIEVATVVQPYAARVVAEADATYLGNNETAWGPEAPDCVVTAPVSLVEEAPAWLPRYLRALVAAEDAFADDTSAAIDVLARGQYYKVDGEALVEGVKRQPPLVRLSEPAIAAMAIGVEDMVELGYVKSVELASGLDLDLLESVA